MSLLIVGTVAFDSIETPVKKVEMVVGGSALFIGYAANYFTKNIHISSIIGDDYSDEELNDMTSRGMDLSGVEVVNGQKSFFWKGKYHDNMNDRDTLITDLNVLANFNPILPESYKECEFVMLGNLTPNIQMSVINQMNKKPKLIMLDTMNYWINHTPDELMEVLKKIDILTINDEEAKMLSGKGNLLQAAVDVLKMGPKYLIIKKGEHGAILFGKDKMFFAPALPLQEIADPTGAGDSFAGGFMGYISTCNRISFNNLKRAVIYGSTLASFCVQDFSNWNVKKLTQDQVKKRAKRFHDLTKFSL